MTDVVVLYTTWPDDETAGRAGREAVEAGLAACVNLMAPMTSVYRWSGAVETARETPALFKTTAEAAGRLRDWLAARHPYETPAILAFPAGAASLPAYVDWVAAETTARVAQPPPQPADSTPVVSGAEPR